MRMGYVFPDLWLLLSPVPRTLSAPLPPGYVGVIMASCCEASPSHHCFSLNLLHLCEQALPPNSSLPHLSVTAFL